jgi:hypothetical protein
MMASPTSTNVVQASKNKEDKDDEELDNGHKLDTLWSTERLVALPVIDWNFSNHH